MVWKGVLERIEGLKVEVGRTSSGDRVGDGACMKMLVAREVLPRVSLGQLYVYAPLTIVC